MSARLGREKQCLIALFVAALCLILFELNVEKVISSSERTKQVPLDNQSSNDKKVQKMMELATPPPEQEDEREETPHTVVYR